jgi:single-strand DNA-binding protein
MQCFHMPDINIVTIAGNLTRNPAFRHTTSGTPVTNFWIASNRRFKDNNGQWRESVCYVGVVAWYKLAENCAQNLQKGSAVIVEGELQSRSLRNDDGRNRNIVEIKARRIQFLSRKEDSESDDEHNQINQSDDLDDDDGNYIFQDERNCDEMDRSLKDNLQRGQFDYGFQKLDF